MRASESAISDAQRALAALEREAREARERIAALETEHRARERALEAQRALLGRLLAARAAAGLDAGAPAALRLLLSGDHPAEAARKLHYLAHLSRAAAEPIVAHREALAALARLRQALEARARELAALEARERAARERLVAERRERRRVLERISEEVARARREAGLLAADERRLARLVEELGRVLAARPGAGHRAVATVPEGFPALPFSRLKGKLLPPIQGQRLRLSRTMKGVFIRAAEGEPVRAVAAGRVVYAEWMRGFGNLLILDHGEDYLTVYGNNEALLKQVGDTVAAGESLAIVGASGGNEETGLYFELRHLGRALDPLAWARFR